MDKLVAILIGVVIAFVIAALFTFPFMWAWNYVMPYMFGLKQVELLHAFCLMFLATTFFKSNFSSKK